MWRRMSAITADSFKPNCASMASNAVRSSQAISTTREMFASQGIHEKTGGTVIAVGLFVGGMEKIGLRALLGIARIGQVLRTTAHHQGAMQSSCPCATASRYYRCG